MAADGAGRPRVLAFGIVVADVFCPVLDAIPAQGHLVQVEDIELHCGGCAANVAIGLSRLGVDVSLVGKVGDDLFGEAVRRYLEDRGVRTDSIGRTDDYGTSKTVVLPVRGEDRRFIHCFGANKAVSAQDLADALTPDLAVVYVGGYLAMPSVDPGETAAALRAARANGTKVVLDVVLPHADPNVSEIRHALEAVLPQTDVFTPNDEEASAITGLPDTYSQAQALLDMGAESVIITRGAQGSYFRSRSEEHTEPPVAVEYVDGSGGGDAFDSGLIYGMVNSLTVRQALKTGAAYGASACRGIGCTASLLNPPEMLEILRVSRM